jgi:lysozyme
MPDTTDTPNAVSDSGIDVSRRQGFIDWSAVAAAGIQFVFIKATEGQSVVDPRFRDNWAGAKSAGILRGAYHFFRPAIPPRAQADNFLTLLQDVDTADLAPVVDLELRKLGGNDAWDAIPLSQRSGLAVEWLTAVEQALGRRPMVYLSPSFALEKLGGATALGAYPLWIAHYTANPQPRVPPAWSDWTFWQYTERGTVSGIAGAVDRNRFNGSANDLIALSTSTPR